MRQTRDGFGAYLRSARERAGISLETIAHSTKIQQSLLAGLERNDVSHWPSGIFRRAFFREYLEAIGIESESLVADFVRLFPESGAPAPDEAFQAFGGELRLTLADAPSASTRRRLVRVCVSAADFSFVLAAGWSLSSFAGLNAVLAMAGVALAYVTVGVFLLGETPAAWIVRAARVRRRPASDAMAAGVGEPAQLRIVARQADVARQAASDSANEAGALKGKARRRAR